MRRCPSCQTAYEDEVAFCPEDGAALAHPEDELIGKSVGPWKLMERIGGGAMGSVYLAQHPSIKSKVAVKFLHRRYSADKIAVGRFANEARAVNLIGHDNIVKVLDLGETADGLHYLVMEFLDGERLDVYMKRARPVPFPAQINIGLQCASGLQAAHEKGIIHRDIKPENIFLTRLEGRENFVKLLDFGVAKLDEALSPAVRTRAGTTLGTPWYMSPEQAIGDPVDARSDIYSLGIILYEMACGQVPFPETDVTASMVAHVQKPPPLPRKVNPKISAEYEAVILKALEKKRVDRQQTMAELREELLRCAPELAPQEPELLEPEPEPALPGRPAEPVVMPVRAPRRAGPPSRERALPTVFLNQEAVVAEARHSWLLGAAIALGAVAVCAIIAVVFIRRRPPPVIRPVVEAPVVERAHPTAPAVPDPQPTMTVRSDPLGAQVRATWKDGSLTGVTPFTFVAPRGSAIHLDFTRDGFEKASLDLMLDQAKLAEVQMQKARHKEASKRPDPKPQPETKPGAPRPQKKEDELVPIGKDDFGDDSFGEGH